MRKTEQSRKSTISRFCAVVYLTMLTSASTALGADDQRGFVYQLGIGRDSCASWLVNATSERDGENWILGYWTGVNSANPGNPLVGKSTDGEGLIGEVRLICTSKPSISLVDATVAVYNQFVRDRR